jgi:hypothetical protein
MEVRLSLEPHDHLVVHLREGEQQTTVSVPKSRPGAETLHRALEAALSQGYGECFWPGVEGGQFWWMFRRDAETLEVVVMWSRGGASGWEHVFRATDSAAWVADSLATEFAKLKLQTL